VFLKKKYCVSFIQPWELDNSISPENREVIERMLLEEQYPLNNRRPERLQEERPLLTAQS